jgi:hypothetical protein
MKENIHSRKLPRGAGYLIGTVVGIALAIPYGIVIGSIPIGIAAGAGMGISIGVALEEQNHKPLTAKQEKVMFAVLTAGVIVFLFLLLRQAF